jgi:carotenoid cleavage dioxygenase
MGGGALADAVCWKPEKGLRFAVRSRTPGQSTQWFQAPTTGYFIHFGNAYQEGRRLIFDAFLYEDGARLLQDLRTFRAMTAGDGFRAHRYQYELDLETGTCTNTKLEEVPSEFPRIDDRLTGNRNRFTYAVASPRGDEGVVLNVLVKYDGFRGRTEYHDFGTGRICSEPVFVPCQVDAKEDEGFLLANVHHGPDNATDLVILDAQNISAQPLAELRLENRVPLGFHGNFAPGVV